MNEKKKYMNIIREFVGCNKIKTANNNEQGTKKIGKLLIYIYTDWELHYYYGNWVKEENVRWESSEYFIHYDIDCVLHMWEIYQWMKWEHCIFVVWERWSALIRNNENLIPKICKQQRIKNGKNIHSSHLHTIFRPI